MLIFVEVILISLVLTLLVTVLMMVSLVTLFWRPQDEAIVVEVMFKGVDDET